ncbi:hypothetical protein [Streptomyces sp. x-80]|uniref:hypothetical protein n=1 Tax=Streptomyces sp. x-80 TaxID=2789282 RepID=UPI00397EA6B2
MSYQIQHALADSEGSLNPTANATVVAPEGHAITGGGFSITGAPANWSVRVIRNEPVCEAVDGLEHWAWEVSVQGEQSVPYKLNAYAVCTPIDAS